MPTDALVTIYVGGANPASPLLNLRRRSLRSVAYHVGNYRRLPDGKLPLPLPEQPRMVAGLRAHLAASGVDPAGAIARGALVLSSDQEHLVDGMFDSRKMLSKLDCAVKKALADGYTGLWVSGDMLWEFGNETNLAKLLTYEVELEELLRVQPALSGICQYHRDTLSTNVVKVALYTHRAVCLKETLSHLNPHYAKIAPLRSGSQNAVAHVDEILDGLRCSRKYV